MENNLPEEVVMSNTVLRFKTLYDRCMSEKKFETIDIYIDYTYKS